jgi:hypothetical protein
LRIVSTVGSDVGERDLRRAGRPRWVRFAIAVLLIVCVFFVVYGSWIVWHSLVTLPHRYHDLRDHGTEATAYLVDCPPVHGRCELSLTFSGETRRWHYDENRRQFSGLNPGSPVRMLVDPRHPATAYTVADVARQINAGWSGPAIYGLVLLMIGLAGGLGLTQLALLVHRTYLPDGRLYRPQTQR